MTSASDPLILGIDVGTGSARAGVFDLQGQMLASAKAELTIWRGPGAMAEQSSAQIWQAVCQSVQKAMAGIDPARVKGLAYDATCSLVVLDAQGGSLPVGPSEDPARDVILWMDHRALDQAARINATGHAVLQYVGGVISPEMETPKLLWLKENRPQIFEKAAHFFDLADFLSWRSTGDLARSTCTLTCKWTYLAHEKRWDPSYFHAIGLGELADEDFARIGQKVLEPGTSLAAGLTETAAKDLGLLPGTSVAVGMIDAHAGGIGTVGIEGSPLTHMAYVFGTSSCTMTSTKDPVFVPGVWGPYYSAMVPGLWLNEGGQSAAGAAIDHLIASHPFYPNALEQAKAQGLSLPALLTETLLADGSAPSDLVRQIKGLHVVPEYLGNRAPHADPHARAAIIGLGIEADLQNLAQLYLAGICGIGYGLRQILDAQEKSGASVDRIVISGGAGQSPLIRQLLADATEKPVLASQAEEPVLLGAATLGAVGAGLFPDVPAAMQALSHLGQSAHPAGAEIAALHQARYRAFGQIQALARDLR